MSFLDAQALCQENPVVVKDVTKKPEVSVPDPKIVPPVDVIITLNIKLVKAIGKDCDHVSSFPIDPVLKLPHCIINPDGNFS